MKRYHGGPITPIQAAINAWTGKLAMVSFAHPDQASLAFEVAHGVALDNGAFSEWKQGVKSDWALWKEWACLYQNHPGFDFCILPDSIEGDEQENDELLSAFGKSVKFGVPVFHLHEDLSRLERLVKGWDRVAIGSSGQYADIGTGSWWRRMSEVMSVACDGEGFPLCKLHGLRQLDPTITSHIPYASADSTNVARNIGIDKKWDLSPYAIRSKSTRAMILRDRIESHATAKRWCFTGGTQMNFELIG